MAVLFKMRRVVACIQETQGKMEQNLKVKVSLKKLCWATIRSDERVLAAYCSLQITGKGAER